MAHDIWQDGQMAHVFVSEDRGSPWHELGQSCTGAATAAQAMELAGLDWQIELHPIGVLLDKQAEHQFGTVMEVPTHRAVVRMSDRMPLGVVGMDYTPIQNQYAFDFVDALLAASDGAHYESAGALGRGERIWCLARVPEGDTSIGRTDDAHECYVLFTTSHDGSQSALSTLTDVRVVCRNTLQMALSKARNLLKVRHTKNAEQRLAAAREVMQGVVMDAKGLSEKFNLLAQRRMTKDSMVTVLDRLFPTEDKSKPNPNRDATLAAVLKLYEWNDNNAFPEIRGSAYNLLNAVTEYTDHMRGVRISAKRKAIGYTESMARAENSLFGTGSELKRDAVGVLMEVTENNPGMLGSRAYSVPSAATAVMEAPVEVSPADAKLNELVNSMDWEALERQMQQPGPEGQQ